MALRELYDSQESITLRSVNEEAMQIPASGPGGSSSKDCKSDLFVWGEVQSKGNIFA